MNIPPLQDRIYRRLHRKEIAPREQQSPDLLKQLIGLGLTPPEAGDVVGGYVDSGQINLPKFRSRTLKPGVDVEPNADLPERSTRDPLPYKNPHKSLYSFDKSKGVFTETPVAADVTGVDVSEFESDPKHGQTIYIDSKTGAEIRREPNGTNKNNVVKVGSTGGGEDSPDVKAAHETHQKYLEKLNQKDSKGNAVPIPDDLLREMESAAPLLGMSMEDVNVPAQEGFFKQALRSSPVTAPLAGPPAEDTTYKRPVFGKGKAAPGKALNADQARLLLKAAGGNKDKARELARLHGYTF